MLFPPLGALGAQLSSGTRAVDSDPELPSGRPLGPGPTQPPSQSLDGDGWHSTCGLWFPWDRRIGGPCLPFKVDPGPSGVLAGIPEVASNENLI